jgi:hypothetical protein
MQTEVNFYLHESCALVFIYYCVVIILNVHVNVHWYGLMKGLCSIFI